MVLIFLSALIDMQKLVDRPPLQTVVELLRGGGRGVEAGGWRIGLALSYRGQCRQSLQYLSLKEFKAELVAVMKSDRLLNQVPENIFVPVAEMCFEEPSPSVLNHS